MNNYILYHNCKRKSILLFLLTAFLLSACRPLAAPNVTPTTTIPTITPSIQPTTAVTTITPSATPNNLTDLLIMNRMGQKILVRVEIPETLSDAFMQGLGNRETLPENQGMLFDWKKDETISFQMWETSIPLSIAFISRDMKILQLEDMQPFYEGTYAPLVPYRYALEVNQGFFKRYQIQVGDTVDWTLW